MDNFDDLTNTNPQPRPFNNPVPPPAPETQVPINLPVENTPPPMPEMPPLPQMQPMPPEPKKRSSILSVLIAVVAVIIIAALAYLIYYYASKSYVAVPVTTVTPPVTQQPQQPVTPAVIPTNVISFVVPDVLPTVIKTGTCVASIAEPYRDDTYRCNVGALSYDPCFATSQVGVVYCPMDPTADPSVSFLIKTGKPLVKRVLPGVIKDNWAWFIQLEDGTLLSPFTGTRPMVDGNVALYGGKITNGERPVLVGELVKGGVWTVQEYILVKDGSVWVTKSSKTAKIDTVWQ